MVTLWVLLYMNAASGCGGYRHVIAPLIVPRPHPKKSGRGPTEFLGLLTQHYQNIERPIRRAACDVTM